MDLVVGASALLEPATGIGIYTQEIASRLPALLPDRTWHYHVGGGRMTPVLPVPPMPGDALPEVPRGWFPRVRRMAGTTPVVGPWLRSGYHHLHLAFDRRRYGLYWEPNNVLCRAVRADRRVLTVHDLSWLHHPEWHPRDRIAEFRRHFARGVRRADHLITGSHRTAGELAGHLGIDARGITVVHHGVDRERFHPWPEPAVADLRRRLDLPGPFVLFVGTMEPRKNLPGLLAAWGHLPPGVRSGLRLVIAGASGWRNQAVREAIAPLGDAVRVLGYLPREDLPGLYSAAAAFVFPSFYEGYGLPPVEAAACGCPVVLSTGLPVEEVLGGVGARVDPADPEAIATGIRSALEAPRAAFDPPTWDQAAQAHAAVLSRW